MAAVAKDTGAAVMAGLAECRLPHESSGHGPLGGECAVSWEFLVVQYIPRELASSISALAFTKNKTLCGAFNLVEAPKLKATEVRSVKPCRIIKEFPFTNQFIERTMFDSDLGLAFCF